MKRPIAFDRTWWLNVYSDGQSSRTFYKNAEAAMNHCTYTGTNPDAIQIEVRIVPVGRLRHWLSVETVFTNKHVPIWGQWIIGVILVAAACWAVWRLF